MGLLFFLAGYFTVPSLDRKGPKEFLKDRLIKLGIPIIVFATFVQPIVDYVIALNQGFEGSFLSYIFKDLPFGLGPLWFVMALLMFAGGYVIWQLLSLRQPRVYRFPKKHVIFAFGLLIGAITFAVRIVFPEGWAVPVLAFQ